MDIRLPGIDGTQALGRLRAEVATQGIPVMAMTASVMSGDRQRVLDAGFDGFESKPINVKGFLRPLNSSLNVIGAEGREMRVSMHGDTDMTYWLEKAEAEMRESG